ncbi:unnamed protein product [Peronospora belbahrii]|uniref:Helicase ATP-binding domain-containing protein n=1 Tax=Peronospora belbahrii TaxID=622444 RepID=A0AAU9L1M7_9STRA|nr:unnamed protein product [Peronospora belbahrii]
MRINVLKACHWRTKATAVTISRALCVNEKVSKFQGIKQNLACRSTCKDRRCMYKLVYDSPAKQSKQRAQPIKDIEEIVTTMTEKTKIVFVPYNYLIDPLARRTVGISIENSILIFDEAHNAELIASEAASSSLSSNDIVVAFQSLTIESIQTLQALFMEIDRGLNNFPVSLSGGFTNPGKYIFECFEQFNVNFETCLLVLSMIEEMVEERTVEAIPTELHHNLIRCFRFWAQFVGEQRTTSDVSLCAFARSLCVLPLMLVFVFSQRATIESIVKKYEKVKVCLRFVAAL